MPIAPFDNLPYPANAWTLATYGGNAQSSCTDIHTKRSLVFGHLQVLMLSKVVNPYEQIFQHEHRPNEAYQRIKTF